ncbi:MAG: YfdX family protein [Alphaproteobacteria bacterium]
MITAVTAAALPTIIAQAASKTDQVVQASKSGKPNPNLLLSQDGYNVIRDVRAARIAIFNGDTQRAKTLTEEAQADLKKVKADDKLADLNKGDKNLVPVDGQLVIADNFVSTPEKAKHIAASNEHIKKGETKKAMDELKLASVDVAFTRILMPIKETEAHVDLAKKQISQGHYYQANMALKATEDALNVETVMLAETPKTKQAKASKN